MSMSTDNNTEKIECCLGLPETNIRQTANVSVYEEEIGSFAVIKLQSGKYNINSRGIAYDHHKNRHIQSN